MTKYACLRSRTTRLEIQNQRSRHNSDARKHAPHNVRCSDTFYSALGYEGSSMPHSELSYTQHLMPAMAAPKKLQATARLLGRARTWFRSPCLRRKREKRRRNEKEEREKRKKSRKVERGECLLATLPAAFPKQAAHSRFASKQALGLDADKPG